MCIYVVLLGVYWDSWICKFIIFTKFEKFWTLLFPIFFSVTPLLSSVSGTSIMDVRPLGVIPQATKSLCSLLVIFFPLCVSFFVYVFLLNRFFCCLQNLFSFLWKFFFFSGKHVVGFIHGFAYCSFSILDSILLST